MNAITVQHQIDLIRRSASETAARSLEVLDAIEQTIDSLRWVADRADADAAFFVREADRIRNYAPSTPIDLDGTRSQSLESVMGEIEKVCQRFSDKRGAAAVAPELTADDGVVDAYNEAISGLSDLHDAINDLRWAVIIQDGLLEKPTGKPEANVDNLFSRIGA